MLQMQQEVKPCHPACTFLFIDGDENDEVCVLNPFTKNTSRRTKSLEHGRFDLFPFSQRNV